MAGKEQQAEASMARTTPLKQLLVALALAGILPLAVLAGVAFFSAHRAYEEEVKRATLDLARAVASAVESELDASLGSLDALANSNELVKEDFEALKHELQRFLARRQDVLSISVADSSARFVLRMNREGAQQQPGAPNAPVEPGSLDAVLRLGTPYVGSIAAGRRGLFAFPVRVPIVGEGKVKYVLTAAVQPDRIKQILDRQQRPQDWVISVFDSRLQRVARSRDHHKTIGGAPAPSLAELLRTAAPEGTGISRALEGDEIVTAYSRVRIGNWVVAVGAPASALAAFTKSALAFYVLGAFVSLAVALPLTFVLARRIRTEMQMVNTRAASIGTASALAESPMTIQETAELMEHVRTADERVRRASAQAARSSAAKDEFLSVLGHELRNPLAPITNVLTLLDLKSDPGTERERQILRRQVRHMARLVDDLLDVQRLVGGRMSLDKQQLDLAALVREVLDSFVQDQKSSTAIKLVLDSTCVLVDADPTRLQQALTNLLINAVKFSAGRPIVVNLRRVDADAELSVTDQGEGMTAETLAHIFQPFFQGRATAGSIGLGLAIVRGIIERHGGTVTATSRGIGEGSTFVIRLPLVAPSSGAHGPEALQAASSVRPYADIPGSSRAG